MTCGCTDNKRLDDDKKISLESMKTLSIDDIIKLYQDGYRLEKGEDFNEMSIQPDIRSLTLSNPDVKLATSNYNGSSTEVLILFSNSGGYGFVRLEALQGATVKGSIEQCFDVRVSPLTFLVSISLSGIVQPIDYIKAYKCNTDSQQNCGASPPTCTSKVLTSNFNTGGLYSIAYNTSSPSAPSGLVITPGNGSLAVSWNSVSDPSGIGEVFAYYFAVYSGVTKIIGGWIPAGIRSITVSNLTNGVNYTVNVASVSHSNTTSSPASGTGTPSAPTPVLTTITISPTSATINVGQTQQFTAACKDQYGATMTCPTLTWESSDPTKATFSGTGLLTGVLAGPTNVTAKSGSVVSNTATTTVTAPTPILTTITISPATTTVQVGAAQQFTAICKDQNGTAMTCPALTWQSSEMTKGTINSSTGLFTGVATGSTNVTAKSGTITSNTATVTVSVPTPVLTTITISPPSVTLSPGSIRTFIATCKDQFTNTMTCPTITWSIDNTSIGTINSTTGIFTAILAGTTTIRATSGTVVGTAYVTVSSTAPVLTTITISPSTASVAPDSTKTFTATPKDQFGNTMTGITITWSVVNTGIGTINSSTGIFTAISEGTTTIRATSGTVVGTATIIVTTAQVQAGGGTILIAAVALLAAVMLMRRKPPSPSPLPPSPPPLLPA